MNNIEEILKQLPEELREEAKKGDIGMVLALINIGSQTLNKFATQANINFYEINTLFDKVTTSLERLGKTTLDLAKKVQDLEARIEKLEIKTNH